MIRFGVYDDGKEKRKIKMMMIMKMEMKMKMFGERKGERDLRMKNRRVI